MNADQEIKAHYRHGNLEQALLAALAAMGKDPERLVPADLMGADEFHIGGAEATEDLAAQLALTPGMRLLDLGSGIGGPARHLAAAYGCHVTGIDLSDEYVAVAESLSLRMGMGDRVAFRQGSATELPFDEASFDGATLLHVGMNIADKRALCAGAHRALRPGGFFAVYDVMRAGPGALDFPAPWASTAETSFVEPPEVYRAALTEAGFAIVAERSRGAFALEFFTALRERQKQSGPPQLGLPIIMGPATPLKIANVIGMLESGVIAPMEMIARR
jgi:ubiquinone/menaquinone biosynthesis C-methylase UbiE